MSHDIASLRAVCERLDEAHRQASVACRDLTGLEVAALAEAFGPDPDAHPQRVQSNRSWGVGDICMVVDFRSDRRAWLCRMWGHHKTDDRFYADTPRSAVTAAIAALAVTHPNEAAALAAVIPEAP